MKTSARSDIALGSISVALSSPVFVPSRDFSGEERGLPRGGALPSNRLMGMCRWMGSHFHDWIDYNGVAFSTELLEWGRIFLGFWGKNILASREFGY